MPYALPTPQAVNLPQNTDIAQDPAVQATLKQQTMDQQNLNNATTQYGALNTGAGMVPQALHDILAKKFNDNQDMIGQVNNAYKTLLNAGTPGAVANNAILQGNPNTPTPFANAALQQGDFKNALADYNSMMQLYNNRMGTMDQLMQQGQGQYQSQVSAAQAAEDAAKTAFQTGQQNYQNAYQTAQDAWNRQMQMAAAQIQQNAPIISAQSNIDAANLMANAYGKMGGGGASSTPTPAQDNANTMNYITSMFGGVPVSQGKDALGKYQDLLYKYGMSMPTSGWSNAGLNMGDFWNAWTAAHNLWMQAGGGATPSTPTQNLTPPGQSPSVNGYGMYAPFTVL